jgi:predicted site-specific integrase-resolvase
MEESDTSVTLEQEKPSGLISVEEAAKRLGLDAFTVYSFIQRDRLSPILDNEGVFLVSEEEANQLAKGKKE